MNKQSIDYTNQDFFLGIDVHKKSWKVTVRTNGMELKTFSMDPSPEQLYGYMHKRYPGGNYHSVYEAGFCGYWIDRELKRYGFNNIVINPADVPTTQKEKSTKTDKVDSRKLARELDKGELKRIYVPDEFHQQLRSLCRLRFRVGQSQTRVKNRIKGHLAFYGYVIPDHDEMSHWSRGFIEWLKTLEFSYGMGRDYLWLCIEELESHRRRLVEILRLLRRYCREYGIWEQVKNLRSVPGVGFVTAITLYGELMDMSRFRSIDQLASYAGLVPSVSGSGERESTLGLSFRRNRYLRYLLIEAAWVAIREDPALGYVFSRLIRRMTKQEAIVRIAKKLLNRIRYVWKHKEVYACGLISEMIESRSSKSQT
jgi:transposase